MQRHGLRCGAGLLGFGIALGIAGGCSREPQIAKAPPYEPPPFTAPPPKMGTGSQTYEYGAHPDYVKGMQQMEASQR